MKIIFLFGLLLFSLGCGIFTPRDEFEEPEGNTLTDPFNFSQILDLTKTGNRFSSTNPREIFNEKMIYSDKNSREEFSRVEFLDNLDRLKLNYVFTVSWSKSSDYQLKNPGDSLIISGVKYVIEYREKDMDNAETLIENGSSTFILIGPVWKISSWIDTPDKVKAQSFFAPIGSE